ncbi:Lipid A biosynthesis lauroyltransferase [Methylobacterium crusticola]|uniref:Lipid A biosynthesis lauroyltransferase n=1 Tax=Methylobacterium crusticola TaxID=1697972 RepID=A0ABQ4QYZ1_9HYPH|nr:lipid A biosynthesis lauroyl acyltransferase [Methylobacterium crusticola]GJD49866.1 Lipid A biosynthesis lauroyltransferase [Methylobacterium crusticola]
MLRLKLRLYRLLSRLAGLPMVLVVRGLFAVARRLGPARAGAAGARIARALGPRLPSHRTALANLRHAFPERSEAEIRAIALGSWENLGRTGAEYAHLAAIFDYDPDAPTPGRIAVEGIEHFFALRDDGRPGLIFSAHLGNWELPAICAARFGLEASAVFRPPNSPAAAQLVQEVRRATMGGLTAAGPGAAFAMQGVVERGGHLGMLVDQHFTRGVVVDFLGRPALANPLLAKLARHYECPVHGVRVIRLPEGRFRLELTPALDLPRDAAGAIDVRGAMQAMTDVIAGWVRDHPEQWLWMHRRWRPALLPKGAPPAADARPPAAGAAPAPVTAPAQANVTSVGPAAGC